MELNHPRVSHLVVVGPITDIRFLLPHRWKSGIICLVRSLKITIKKNQFIEMHKLLPNHNIDNEIITLRVSSGVQIEGRFVTSRDTEISHLLSAGVLGTCRNMNKVSEIDYSFLVRL